MKASDIFTEANFIYLRCDSLKGVTDTDGKSVSEFSTLRAGRTSSCGSGKSLLLKYPFPFCVSVASAAACSVCGRVEMSAYL